MSTAGSGPSAGPDPAAVTAATTTGSSGVRPRRSRIVRWRGLIPLTVGLVLLGMGWLIFGEPITRGTVEEAATEALGAQVDIADLQIDELRTTIVMRGVAIAHPFDVNRNLVEAGSIRLELEGEPLLERKLIVKRLTLGDVRAGTARTTPARPVSGGGFAPDALREMDRWARGRARRA